MSNVGSATLDQIVVPAPAPAALPPSTVAFAGLLAALSLVPAAAPVAEPQPAVADAPAPEAAPVLTTPGLGQGRS